MGPPAKQNGSRREKEDAEPLEVAAAIVPGGDATDPPQASGGATLQRTSGSGRPTVDSTDVEDQFLCITVREARNLLAKDYETASSDP